MGNNVYLNGQILPIEKAKISVNDRGFLYGDALIETLRTYKSVPFMLKSHLSRLLESAQILDFKIGALEEYKDAVYNLIRANGIEEAVIRITLTRGDSQERNLVEIPDRPNLLISMMPLDTEEIARSQSGVLAISGEDRRSTYSKYKTSSMMPSIMAYKQAKDNGAFDIIQIIPRGFVTEASRCNVFVIIDGMILTPPVDNRVLPGVTRKLVIDIAKRNNLKVEEDAVMGQDLATAEEIFLTNSLYEVVPVISLNNKPIADGQKGPITQQIQKAYRTLVDAWLEQVFAKV